MRKPQHSNYNRISVLDCTCPTQGLKKRSLPQKKTVTKQFPGGADTDTNTLIHCFDREQIVINSHRNNHIIATGI